MFQQYNDKLASDVGEHISLKLHTSKDGVARVSLEAVPVDMLAEVIRVLAEVEPTPALKAVGA